MTHSDIIAKKGTAEISAALAVPRARVRVWKHRGIPKASWADFLAAFPDVTLATLKAGRPA